MATLTFDSRAAFNGLREEIIKMADMLIDEYYNEIQYGMDTPEGRESLELGLSKDDRTLIHREIIGGAWAIIDSFGTGSKMDTSNPFLTEYKQSALWNPERHTNTIVGRPKGSYTNIFGETKESSGKMAGLYIEHIVDVKTPSMAFQNAWRWMQAGNRVGKRLQECIRGFNFARYFVFR